MERVDFYPFLQSDQAHLQYALIMALHKGKWLFVKHRCRDTLEIPGGRREPGEDILQAAHRELFEETGALRYQLAPIAAYSTDLPIGRVYGLLAFAMVDEIGPLPESEIDRVIVSDSVPTELTYRNIPALSAKVFQYTGLLQRIANYKNVIFDWNGTLLDDTQICVDVISDLLAEYGLPRITRDHYRSIFGFPVIDYYRKIGFDFDRVPFQKLGDQFIARYRERLHEARLFEDVPLTLEILKQRKTRLSILSAASQHHLEEATEKHRVRHLLDKVYGTSDHYASSKLARGRELLEVTQLPPAETLLVGDTDHDLEVGHELGLDVLLVADGHQHYDRLRQKHVNTLASRFLTATPTERVSK